MYICIIRIYTVISRTIIGRRKGKKGRKSLPRRGAAAIAAVTPSLLVGNEKLRRSNSPVEKNKTVTPSYPVYKYIICTFIEPPLRPRGSLERKSSVIAVHLQNQK